MIWVRRGEVSIVGAVTGQKALRIQTPPTNAFGVYRFNPAPRFLLPTKEPGCR